MNLLKKNRKKEMGGIKQQCVTMIFEKRYIFALRDGVIEISC